MVTNTKEGGLEAIIVNHLRDVNGYVEGTSDLYSKDEAIVKSWLETFLLATQPDKVARSMCFASVSEKAKFYARLCEALAKRGVTDVLRKGFSFNGTTFDMYFPLPSEQNPSAKEAYEKNCFGVIRQLHYSKIDANDAIDFVVFINGLPLATFELKNHYTRQTVENAIRQYQTDRNPKEVLLKPKRCAVHFAVDDTDVYMCTELKGTESWFLPFNRGVNGGAGNPVIPGKTMTSYLWEEVFTKSSLSNIIENFAQVIVAEEKKTHKLKERVVWPRYHQLDAVRCILEATACSPVGRKFLIQHSAGSGKSNTITWLAYQLVMARETAAAFELARRGYAARVAPAKTIGSSADAAAIFRAVLGENAEKEIFWALPLDPKRRPLSEPQTIAIGTLNGVNVHPRDVFSIAVRWNAHSIVVAHNHPSGSSLPSKRVVDLTWGLYGAGKMIGIPLVDHIIITDKSHYSFADNERLCRGDFQGI